MVFWSVSDLAHGASAKCAEVSARSLAALFNRPADAIIRPAKPRSVEIVAAPTPTVDSPRSAARCLMLLNRSDVVRWRAAPPKISDQYRPSAVFWEGLREAIRTSTIVRHGHGRRFSRAHVPIGATIGWPPSPAPTRCHRTSSAKCHAAPRDSRSTSYGARQTRRAHPHRSFWLPSPGVVRCPRVHLRRVVGGTPGASPFTGGPSTGASPASHRACGLHPSASHAHRLPWVPRPETSWTVAPGCLANTPAVRTRPSLVPTRKRM